MFIELVDVLRCPRPHEETWLVLAARRVDDRDVMEGTLGCPVCHAEYPIEDGIARFDGGAPRLTSNVLPDESEALRLAALLDLSDARGYAALVGNAGACGPLIVAMTDAPLLLIDPPVGVGMGHGLSGLTLPHAAARLPLAHRSARGIVLDWTVRPQAAPQYVDVLRPGGRLVAPVSLPLPAGVIELARDERAWVAERAPAAATSAIVGLSRRR